MASACVNNIESFSPSSYTPYGWLSPRVSVSREDDCSKASWKTNQEGGDPLEVEQAQDPGDFEFMKLEDPVAMLPADELFSDGKLVPLKFSGAKQAVQSATETRSPQAEKACRRVLEMEISGMDACVFSPKAPRCTSRWRELLGLKKSTQSSKSESATKTGAANLSSSSALNIKPTSSLKLFLHRSSKSSTSSTGSSSDGSSLNLPLLNELECESLSISSSRLSLSSSSSGHEHDDLPRLSLDSEKPSPNPFAPSRSFNPTPPRMRLVKPRPSSDGTQQAPARIGRSRMRRPAAGESACTVAIRGVSVDSPRLNSSGKLVFQNLERSSSSPSTLNGGPRYKHRGMERSYSANVRVTPVLNVPVCSLRGSSKSSIFGQLFSSSSSSTSSPSSSLQHKSSTCGRKSSHQSHGKNRTDRT